MRNIIIFAFTAGSKSSEKDRWISRVPNTRELREVMVLVVPCGNYNIKGVDKSYLEIHIT